MFGRIRARNLLRIIAVFVTLISLQLAASQMILVAAMSLDMSMSMMQSGCPDNSCVNSVGCGLSPVISAFTAQPWAFFHTSAQLTIPDLSLFFQARPPTV